MPMKLNKKSYSKYVAVHIWINRHYGKAAKCEMCDNPKGYRYEWANISGEYKRDRSDFMELCQSCHKKHDHGNKCKRGHEYTKQNTYRRPDGNRDCRICRGIALKKSKLKKQLYEQMD